MFEHLNDEAPGGPRIHRTILLGAVAGTLLGVGGLVYGVLWVLSMLGFTNIPAPVEVHLDPFDDGTRLVDLIGDEERPLPLEEIDAAADTASEATPGQFE